MQCSSRVTYWSRAEEQNPLHCPAAQAAPDAAQDLIAFLVSECSWLGLVEFFISHHPQVLLSRPVLNRFIQPAGVSGVATLV